MTDKAPQDLCLLKRAIKTLLRQNPQGLTHAEICRLLRQENFPGTYRNLLFQSSSILGDLAAEGKIIKSTIHDSRYMIRDSKRTV